LGRLISLLGVLWIGAALYYWVNFSQEVLLIRMPLFFRYTFRLTPQLDIVLTILGMLLLIIGIKTTRYKPRRDELKRFVLKRRHWEIIVLWLLALAFGFASVMGPLLKWTIITTAWQEATYTSYSSKYLLNPLWLMWVVFPWVMALINLLSVIIRSRSSLFMPVLAGIFLFTWANYEVNIKTGFQYQGVMLTFIGVIGLTVLSLVDHFWYGWNQRRYEVKIT